MEPWKTALSNSDENNIWIRGQEVSSLMATASFTEVVFLLHHGLWFLHVAANKCRLLLAPNSQCRIVQISVHALFALFFEFF